MREIIVAQAERAIQQRVFSGGVVGFIHNGKKEVAAFGCHTYDPDSLVVTEDSLYDCASITKSIPTATLALQLIDEGKLSLDDRLKKYVPEYRTKYQDEVTIRHLLTYTLGNTTPLSKAGTTPEAIFKTICTEKGNQPGTIFSYSNTPAFLLGICIERIIDTSLELEGQIALFDPQGMKNTTFSPHGAVPTEEGIQDIVHDESARVFSRAGKTVGHAGLFSTAPDLLQFLRQLLITRDERLCTNQIAYLNASTALGWELNQPHFMGNARTSRTFGKTGFTGTSIVCDFDRETAIVILSNRTYPQRPKDTFAINSFRSFVCDIVFSS